MSSEGRIIALLGEAGSGKDLTASLILEHTEGVALALADPLKEFCQEVFGFTHEQLWGPSHFRNAVDPRLSFDEEKPGFWRFPYNARRKMQVKEVRKEVTDNFFFASPTWLRDVLPPGYSPGRAITLLDQWFFGVMELDQITARTCLQLLGTEFGRRVSENIWIDRGLRKAHSVRAARQFAVIKDTRFLNEAERVFRTCGEVWRIDRPGLDLSHVEKAGVKGHQSEAEIRSPAMDQFVTRTIKNDGNIDKLRQEVLKGLQALGV